MDERDKQPVDVKGFPVKVLGGTFVVKKVLLGQQERRDDVLSLINTTEPDRWFVMVGDNGAEEQDALAMLDDDLEVQIYAQGVLRQA